MREDDARETRRYTELNELLGRAIGCAFTVLNTLGAGFLEEVHENRWDMKSVPPAYRLYNDTVPKYTTKISW